MPKDQGRRLLGAALLQGSVDWGQVRQALETAGDAAATPEAFLRHLADLGVLPASDLAALESGLPEEPTTAGPEVSGTDPGDQSLQELLGALAVPHWRQYRNLKFIGEGGMGRIFKAYDTTLQRIVALKFLRRREPQLMARFRQEARLHGRLEHPHICRVYEVVEWQGQVCIAMQFIDGETLEHAARDLSIREMVSLMADVADAVHSAHRQGLIHRDLKPANIMVERPEGQPPRAFVLDFGLARVMEEPGLTQTGAVMGTYHYMAPEQAMGRSDLSDRRTDVYALGATLYAILSGHPPFWESDGAACAVQVIEQPVVPLRKVAPDLPEDLATVVERCLEKSPDRRYPSARALAEDLRRVLEDEPVEARRVGLLRRLLPWKRSPLTLALAAGTMASLAWLAVGTVRSIAQERQALRTVQLELAVERLQYRARTLAQLPIHDAREGRKRLWAEVSALQTRVEEEGVTPTGAWAVGQGWLLLDEPREALSWLTRAAEAQPAPTGAEDLLAHALLALWLQRRAEADVIQDPELRRLEARWLTRATLPPSLRASAAHLGPVGQSALALMEQRLEDAQGHLRNSAAETSWTVDLLAWEGELHRLAAEREPRRLQSAAEAYRQAIALAPSHPRLRLGLSSVLLAQLEHPATSPADDQALRRQVAETLEASFQLDPRSAEAARLAVRFQPERIPTLVAQLGPERPEARALGLLAALRSAAGTERASRLDAVLREAEALERESGPRLEIAEAAASAACARLALAAAAGKLDREAFQAGLDRAGALGRVRPGSPVIPWLTAALWRARADAEARLGLDPALSHREAAGRLAEARRLGGR